MRTSYCPSFLYLIRDPFFNALLYHTYSITRKIRAHICLPPARHRYQTFILAHILTHSITEEISHSCSLSFQKTTPLTHSTPPPAPGPKTSNCKSPAPTAPSSSAGCPGVRAPCPGDRSFCRGRKMWWSRRFTVWIMDR